jgi:hypothetical protein
VGWWWRSIVIPHLRRAVDFLDQLEQGEPRPARTTTIAQARVDVAALLGQGL